MLDGNVLLTEVGGKYGAPMGRQTINDNQQATVTLFLVRMVDGDYDKGGAYWGQGNQPLYAAIGDGFQHFLRAETISDAKEKLLEEYPELTVQFTDVNDDFVNAYIEAILFTEVDDDDDPLDRKYEASDFDDDLIKKITEDCGKFLAKCGHLITRENCKTNIDPFKQAGHDFWLTRNGHGSGFWDGDWKKRAATKLTAESQEMGESYVYLGDPDEDGRCKIYG